MNRGRYVIGPGGVHREQSNAVASRCAKCGGEGLLELAPLDPPRDNRYACVLCRADRRRRLQAAANTVEEPDPPPNMASAPPGVASFTCPECGAVSYNRGDIRAGYCGACNDWTGPGNDLLDRPFIDISVKDEVL